MPDDPLGIPISDVSATLDDIQNIINKFNTVRSCVIEIDNNTDHVLTLNNSTHSSGGFAQTPKASIDAHSYDVFGSQKSAWAFMTGASGAALYRIQSRPLMDFQMIVTWNVPYIGGNTAVGLRLARMADLFELTSVAGAGDEGAHIRHTLSPTLGFFSIDSKMNPIAFDVP